MTNKITLSCLLSIFFIKSTLATTIHTQQLNLFVSDWIYSQLKQKSIETQDLKIKITPNQTSTCQQIDVQAPLSWSTLNHFYINGRCTDNHQFVSYAINTEFKVKTYQTNQDIAAERVIQASDIQPIYIEYTPATMPLTLKEIVGKTSTQNIPANQVLRTYQLKKTWAIQLGQAITIQAQSEGITVALPGMALQSGAIGDTIRVKNSKTQKSLNAKVISATTVELLL